MGRSKNFDEKKALQAAMLLFWRKGYSASSLKELEFVMGLKPTSIYNTFGSKRDLFERALNFYLENVLIKFIEPLNDINSVKEAIHSVLMEVIQLHYTKSHPGGCMVVLSLLESEQLDVKTKKILDLALFQLRDFIFKRLEQGQDTGELNPKLNCMATANHVIALIPGVITMAKSGFTRQELEELMSHSCNILLQ